MELFTPAVVSSDSMNPMSLSLGSIFKETICYVTVVIFNIQIDCSEGSSERNQTEFTIRQLQYGCLENSNLNEDNIKMHKRRKEIQQSIPIQI